MVTRQDLAEHDKQLDYLIDVLTRLRAADGVALYLSDIHEVWRARDGRMLNVHIEVFLPRDFESGLDRLT